MVVWNIRYLEGGEVGTRVKERILEASEQFFELGVDRIAQECNQRRFQLQSEWQTKPPVEHIPGICVTYAQGLQEIQGSFDLYEPAIANMYIHQRWVPRKPNDYPIPMETLVNRGIRKAELCVYLDQLEPCEDTYRWKDPTKCIACRIPTLDLLTFHELLHVCGDVGPCFDTIRENLIGVNAILCLKQYKSETP